MRTFPEAHPGSRVGYLLGARVEQKTQLWGGFLGLWEY